MVLCRRTPKPTKRRRKNNHNGEIYLRRSVPWRTAGFVTTCLSLWKVELEKGESNNDGVTVVSRHASGGPYDVARRKILSWPLKSLKLKWRELNKNSPPVMWHGVVGADDNSFLVVVASRQKCPYNKFHFINKDFQSRENRKWKLPRPLQYRMTMGVHSSKRRMKSRTWCGKPLLCLYLGMKCENPEKCAWRKCRWSRQWAGIASRRIMQPKRDTMRPSKRWLNWYWFQQTRRMRCRRDCARFPPQPWGRS